MDYLQFSTSEGEGVSFVREGDVVFIIVHEDEITDTPVNWQYERLLEKTRKEWKNS